MQTQNVQVHTALDAVKRSGCLGNSTRQIRLLKYLLTEEYEGRGARIKAYSIALDVLGRSDDFDNNTDSIVRVEMHRLRKKLKNFNEKSSNFNLVLPKASYRIQMVPKISSPENLQNTNEIKTAQPLYKNPGFMIGIFSIFLAICAWGFWMLSTQNQKQPPVRTTDLSCSNETPNLHILPTIVVGAGRIGNDMALMVDDYLRTGLRQYPLVYLTSTPDCLSSGSPYYTLEAKIFSTADLPYVSFISRHSASQSIIFTEKIDLPEGSTTIPESVSWEFYKIASMVAQGGAALSQDAQLRPWKNKQGHQDYQCLIMAQSFDAARDDSRYREAVSCLETAIQGGNTNPFLHGLLAISYMDQIRGYRVHTTDVPYEKAKALVEKAEETTPNDSTILRARLLLETEHVDSGMVESFAKERIKNTLNALEQQQAFNSHILIPISQTFGYKLGDWETAYRISQRAIKIDRTGSNSIHFVSFAYELLYAEPEQAYQTSLKLYESSNNIALLMGLAAANRAGEYEQAQKCKEHLAALGFATIDDYVTFIEKRNYEPQITTALIKWLRAPEEK